MSNASYRQYLETLGEEAVRRQLDNQMMNGREGLARAWLVEKEIAREDAQDSRRRIIQILVVAFGVGAATVALPIIKSLIG